MGKHLAKKKKRKSSPKIYY